MNSPQENLVPEISQTSTNYINAPLCTTDILPKNAMHNFSNIVHFPTTFKGTSLLPDTNTISTPLSSDPHPESASLPSLPGSQIIINHRRRAKHLEYLIQERGDPQIIATWVPSGNITDPTLIDKYIKSREKCHMTSATAPNTYPNISTMEYMSQPTPQDINFDAAVKHQNSIINTPADPVESVNIPDVNTTERGNIACRSLGPFPLKVKDITYFTRST